MSIDRTIPNNNQDIPTIVDSTRNNLNQLEDDYKASDSILDNRISNLESGRYLWDSTANLVNNINLKIMDLESISNEIESARSVFATLGDRLTNNESRFNEYYNELSSSRGSRDRLNSRLSVFLDDYGNPKISQIVTQFVDLEDLWTLVSSNQIKTNGDKSGKYLPSFQLMITDSEGDKYCQIDNTTYDSVANTTTITLTNSSPLLSGNITKVKLAIISLDFGLTESIGILFNYVFDLYNKINTLGV